MLQVIMVLPLNIVSIFRCTRPPSNPVFVRRLHPSVLVFSLSLHRHLFVCILFNSRFIYCNKHTLVYRCFKIINNSRVTLPETNLFHYRHTVFSSHLKYNFFMNKDESQGGKCHTRCNLAKPATFFLFFLLWREDNMEED